MKLYIQQKVFSFKDKFKIWSEMGEPKYYAEGEFFSLGKKLHIYDLAGNEVIFISQKVFRFWPTYTFSVNGSAPAEMKKNFTFFRQEYVIPEYDITVHGDFFAHEYEVFRAGKSIATLSKHWFTFGDAYEIEIADPADELLALAVILVVDCCMAQAENNNN